MNYPIQQLAIVAPIMFIVMAIAFPLIGVFGGWKRSLFWGGGNFLFYIIGLLVLMFAGSNIAAFVANFFTQMKSDVQNIENIIQSIVPIGFCLIVPLVGNLFLLINYYAWFKRGAKIGKYEVQQTTSKNKKSKNGAKVVKLNGKQRAINMVVGGVTMTGLMAPTVFSLNQGVMYATTSLSTRKSNSFASSMYDFFDKTNSAFSFMSYYKTTASDMDALFAYVAISGKSIKYTDADGNKQEGTVVDALSNTFTDGFGDIYKALTEQSTEKPVDEINQFIVSWNSIVEATDDNLEAFFNSPSFTDLIKDCIPIPEGEETTITTEQWSKYKENIENALESEDIVESTKIAISDDCFNNITDSFSSFYEFSTDFKEEDKQAFNEDLKKIMGLIFELK